MSRRAGEGDARKKKAPSQQRLARGLGIIPGGDLLSHRVSPAVPSALKVLTSEFEMGSGVAPPVRPPEPFVVNRQQRCQRSATNLSKSSCLELQSSASTS